MKVVTL